MKKLILVFAAIAITAGAYAQTDSISSKKSLQDINNTNDSLNQNQDMNNDLNQNQDMNNNLNQSQDMNKNKNQSQDMNKNQNQNVQKIPVDKSHPDGIMMKNGNLVMVKNGQTTHLDRDTTMSNGTKIMSDGTCIKKDGTKTTIKEGQHVDAACNVIPMKTKKDKNVYNVPDSAKRKDVTVQ